MSEITEVFEGLDDEQLAHVQARLPATLRALRAEAMRASQSKEQERLKAEYQQDVAKLRRGDLVGITNLQTTYRKRGLDV